MKLLLQWIKQQNCRHCVHDTEERRSRCVLGTKPPNEQRYFCCICKLSDWVEVTYL